MTNISPQEGSMETHAPTGELRAQLSAAKIDDLPDSDFAYIEPGGKKDAEGKTVPRSLRHFPIQDADADHVRDALSRAPQSPFGDKAMPKIKAAAKKFGIDQPQQKNSALIAAQERRKKERHRAVPLIPEVRHWAATGLEVRSASNTDEIIISGSPIVYDSPYTVADKYGEFEERMAHGVASDVMARGADVRFLFNHDGLPLARSISGTLTLSDSANSLNFEARLDARQQLANDLSIAIERGDVSQMSCGFIVDRDEWDDSYEHRTVLQFSDLLDVSAVTYPASPATSIAIARRMAADIRAGKVLSQANHDTLISAAKAIHQILGTAGVDARDLIDEPEDVTPPEAPSVEVHDDGAVVTSRTKFSTLRLQAEARRRRRPAA